MVLVAIYYKQVYAENFNSLRRTAAADNYQLIIIGGDT